MEENMAVEWYLVLGVLLLVEFLLILKMRINRYKKFMKKENGRLQTAEIVEWKALYYTRSTIYVLKIIYMENNEKKQKIMASSNSFLKKYKNENYISIVTVPGTDFIFFQEEKWIMQNIVLKIIAIIISIVTLPLFFVGILGVLLNGVWQTGLFLFTLIVFVYIQESMENISNHKSRMAYHTNLTCEKVLESLKQQTNKNFQFKKESEDSKDKVYILSASLTPFYIKKLQVTAQYRVLITPSQEGSTVWIYLFACSNSYVLNQFAGKIGDFLHENIQAFRME